jgi:diaminopimelate epimerase
LFNSDGSEPEISGNGTRCAATFAVWKGIVSGPAISITTAAGKKMLHLMKRQGNSFLFEMDMGLPALEELHATMHLGGSDYDATLLNVGNPQCAIFVEELPSNWRMAAQEAEGHTRFPNRCNVSFVRLINRNVIECVFYERGAGETRSSGTGSTGAGAAAILRNIAESPLDIRTPAGSMSLRWDDSIYLTGPAEVIGEGRFYLDQ